MNNKLAFKSNFFAFGLFLINGIFFLYRAARCEFSSFYCFDEYGIILFILGICTAVLFFVSLGLFIFRKFYKGEKSWINKGIPYFSIVLSIIAFIPLLYSLFIISQNPSYKEWLAQQEQFENELEQKRKDECLDIKEKTLNRKEGDPVPTWRIECDKYIN